MLQPGADSCRCAPPAGWESPRSSSADRPQAVREQTMKATILCGALAAAVLTAAAHADFNAALAEYRDGHYDSARRQFTAMAELGDCSSQFNLGVMVLQGQGGAKDIGTGIGWLAAGGAHRRQAVGRGPGSALT